MRVYVYVLRACVSTYVRGFLTRNELFLEYSLAGGWLSRERRDKQYARISGISFKNGSRPLWIPSDGNDRSELSSRGTFHDCRCDTRRRFGGGTAREMIGSDRGRRRETGREERIPFVCGCMRARAHRGIIARHGWTISVSGGTSDVKHVERRRGTRKSDDEENDDDDDASCAITQLPTFGARENFSHASEKLVRARDLVEELKGCGIEVE